MYEKLLEVFEKRLSECSTHWDLKEATDLADLIIKIKTIKYMDLQTEILQASRRVSLN